VGRDIGAWYGQNTVSSRETYKIVRYGGDIMIGSRETPMPKDGN